MRLARPRRPFTRSPRNAGLIRLSRGLPDSQTECARCDIRDPLSTGAEGVSFACCLGPGDREAFEVEERTVVAVPAELSIYGRGVPPTISSP